MNGNRLPMNGIVPDLVTSWWEQSSQIAQSTGNGSIHISRSYVNLVFVIRSRQEVFAVSGSQPLTQFVMLLLADVGQLTGANWPIVWMTIWISGVESDRSPVAMTVKL